MKTSHWRSRDMLPKAFWDKVQINPNGCWLWTGAIDTQGYGRIARTPFGQKAAKVHRLIFEHVHGAIPNGAHICHTCHRQACINPNHLYAGTAQSNMDDKMKAGRHRTTRGAECSWSKLDDAKVLEIRRLAKAGENWTKLGYLFGVSESNIRQIVTRKSWKHLPEEVPA